MVTGEQVAAAAARLVGTPYAEGGRTSRGLDCSGLLIAVCRELGLPARDDSPGHCNASARARMEASLDDQCERCPVERLAPGMIVGLAIRDGSREIEHCGIAVGGGERCRMVHAMEFTGVIRNGRRQPGMVVETCILRRRARAAWMLPGVCYADSA